MNKEIFILKLNAINIVERFKELCSSFNDRKNSLSGNHHDTYKKYLEKYGYTIESDRRESFFRFNTKITDEYSLGMQFVLKDGIVETVLGLRVNDVVIKPSGRIDFMPMKMGFNFDKKIYKLPSYKSFEELESILNITFGIFEDLKKEIVELSPPINLTRQIKRDC
ncbi:hypothetical protein RI844_04915 [Thalassotalea fonticola]|uniref:Uncharacterized protein n=1 Tax=Thalassotalea fonticola TaxID=3065649 RepID=A0ABZ0GS82_9GAMM|nr:hypothetical protein RI844_04915 [Colwelliaceae bacterium S1-1]